MPAVDLLILLGVMRDMIVERSVHRVHLYVLPAFIMGQTVVTYPVFNNLAYWRKIARQSYAEPSANDSHLDDQDKSL
jgi:hypothetical protein